MSAVEKREQTAQKITRTEVTPVSHVTECEGAYSLVVELPGVAQSEIELTLENQVLTVVAENSLAPVLEHTMVLNEIPEVRYRCAFDLPDHIDPAGIKASNKNGMLVLTLPKREEVKPRRIAVATG